MKLTANAGRQSVPGYLDTAAEPEHSTDTTAMVARRVRPQEPGRRPAHGTDPGA